MELDLTGLHIDVTEGIREYTEKKIKKLEKFFKDDCICHVTFSAKKNVHHVDIRIEYKSRTYLAHEDTDDLYKGIDKCINKLEGQIRKVKDHLNKKRHEGTKEEHLDSMTLEDVMKEIEE